MRGVRWGYLGMGIGAGVRQVASLAVVEPEPLIVTADTQPVSEAVDEPVEAPIPLGIGMADSKPQPQGLESRPVTVPDDELDRIIRAALASNPKAGFGTVEKAIRDGGWLVGNTERVKDALRAQKQPGLRVVAGSGS